MLSDLKGNRQGSQHTADPSSNLQRILLLLVEIEERLGLVDLGLRGRQLNQDGFLIDVQLLLADLVLCGQLLGGAFGLAVHEAGDHAKVKELLIGLCLQLVLGIAGGDGGICGLLIHQRALQRSLKALVVGLRTFERQLRAEQLLLQLWVGQHVTVGTSVAEVVQLDKLKAALQIAETQAHDIQLDQPAEVDTHNGIVTGHVIRIDPSVVNGTRTVDVSLDGALPPGAVPQLSVDGTIDLQRLTDVLFVGRPAFGNENSAITLFRMDPDGKTATRVQVKVGRASVTQIQILDGLKEGDRVILSDMSRYDSTDKVRLN